MFSPLVHVQKKNRKLKKPHVPPSAYEEMVQTINLLQLKGSKLGGKKTEGRSLFLNAKQKKREKKVRRKREKNKKATREKTKRTEIQKKRK